MARKQGFLKKLFMKQCSCIEQKTASTVIDKRGNEKSTHQNHRNSMATYTYIVNYNPEHNDLEEQAQNERSVLVKWIVEKMRDDSNAFFIIDMKNVPLILTERYGKFILEEIDDLVRQAQASQNLSMPADVTTIWDRISGLEPLTNFAVWWLTNDYKPDTKIAFDVNL